MEYSSSYKDITDEPWAVPGNRKMTTKHFKLIGARVEIHRCNCEAQRLCTSIQDEQLMYVEHISHVPVSDGISHQKFNNKLIHRRELMPTL